MLKMIERNHISKFLISDSCINKAMCFPGIASEYCTLILIGGPYIKHRSNTADLRDRRETCEVTWFLALVTLQSPSLEFDTHILSSDTILRSGVSAQKVTSTVTATLSVKRMIREDYPP